MGEGGYFPYAEVPSDLRASRARDCLCFRWIRRSGNGNGLRGIEDVVILVRADVIRKRRLQKIKDF